MSPSKNKIIINKIFTILTLASLVYLCLAYVGKYSAGLIFSSDILSIPYLYQDLFIHHGSLAQWIFPPTMCYFPDVIVYFILVAIVGNIKLGIALFAIYQMVLYYWLLVYIGKKMSGNKSGACLFSLSVFLTLFLYSAGYLQQNIFYSPIFSGHFGTALMFLVGLILIVRTFNSKSWLNYFFLFWLCFLTVFSDLLFITQFVLTALASLFIMAILSEKAKAKIHWLNMITIGIGTLLAYICFNNSKHWFHLHIVHDHGAIRRHHWHQLVLASEKIVAKLTMFYQQNAIIILALFVFFFIALVFLTKSFFKRLKGTKLNSQNESFVFTILMLFMAILTGYCSLIFLDNNLMSSDPSLRHFQPFVLFPVFLGLPLFIARFSNLAESVNKYYIPIILALLSCAFIFAPSKTIKPLLTYYPPEVACVDHYAKEYDLKNGVGQYWDAKLTSVLSKTGVNVVAITNNKGSFVPYLWYNTINAYLGKNFNFVMVHKQNNIFPNAEETLKQYAKHFKILSCSNDSGDPIDIYIYKSGAINQNWTKQELTIE